MHLHEYPPVKNIVIYFPGEQITKKERTIVYFLFFVFWLLSGTVSAYRVNFLESNESQLLMEGKGGGALFKTVKNTDNNQRPPAGGTITPDNAEGHRVWSADREIQGQVVQQPPPPPPPPVWPGQDSFPVHSQGKKQQLSCLHNSYYQPHTLRSTVKPHTNSYVEIHLPKLKGTVARDFLLLVFFS
jgi:hypothetical protein